MSRKKFTAFGLLLLPMASVIIAGCFGGSDQVSACLITKTDTNPFFVKMKEGAEAKAMELDIELTSSAGMIDGDSATQIEAVETCIADGVDGILITPSDDTLASSLREAREAGILVIALDTPLADAQATDATFATDNFEAGRLIGAWAKGAVNGQAEGLDAPFSEADARIATLDLNASMVSVDVQRNQGFLMGFGVDLVDRNRIGDETDSRVLGSAVTNGNEEGGRNGLETLLQANPEINLIHTINEPAAAGARLALEAVNRDTVGKGGNALIVSVDGGCAGVRDVQDGVIGATSMQFPLLMASKGIEAISAFAEDETKPQNSAGLDFFNTGVELITDNPVPGVESRDVEWGLDNCWG